MSMISRQKLIEAIEREFDGVCVYDVSPSQAVSDFIEIVDRQPPADVPDTNVGEWIPCSERLPKETDWYPVTIQYGDEEPYIGISEYYTGEGEFYVCGKAGWYCDGYPVDDCITAWKERPEPYKEGEKHE